MNAADVRRTLLEQGALIAAIEASPRRHTLSPRDRDLYECCKRDWATWSDLVDGELGIIPLFWPLISLMSLGTIGWGLIQTSRRIGPALDYVGQQSKAVIQAASNVMTIGVYGLAAVGGFLLAQWAKKRA